MYATQGLNFTSGFPLRRYPGFTQSNGKKVNVIFFIRNQSKIFFALPNLILFYSQLTRNKMSARIKKLWSASCIQKVK